MQQGGEWRTRQARQWLADWTGKPTFVHRQAHWNNRGVRQTVEPMVLAQETKDSKPQAVKKSVGFVVARETRSLTGEFTGERHRVLEHTQARPPGNQHQKGPI